MAPLKSALHEDAKVQTDTHFPILRKATRVGQRQSRVCLYRENWASPSFASLDGGGRHGAVRSGGKLPPGKRISLRVAGFRGYASRMSSVVGTACFVLRSRKISSGSQLRDGCPSCPVARRVKPVGSSRRSGLKAGQA